MWEAAEKGHTAIVEALLVAGADMNKADKHVSGASWDCVVVR